MKFPGGSSGETLIGHIRLLGRGISLRVWFTAFALVVCSAIIAMFAISVVHERNMAVEVARRAAENLAESLAQQASDTLKGADGVLTILVKRRGHDGLDLAKRYRLHDTMAAFAGTMPRIDNLSITDERGRLQVSNFSSTGIGWPGVTDRAYFRFHRNDPGLGVHISGPSRSKINNAWVLFATRRLERADGTFAGVAMAPISLSYFERSYASVDVGRSGTIMLIAEDGTIMFRKPRTAIGRRLRDSGVFADPYKFQRTGWYIRSSHVDGVRRLFAFRRLDRYPLIVQVALAESEYLADWRSSTRSGTIAVSVIILMICGLAGVLGGQIGRRKVAEETLSRLALLDGLTGLANRRQFDAVFEREWGRAARDQTSLALLLIDVDNFKSYNDLYGHQLGDKALILIAGAIAASSMRPADSTARYGGEEFVVILPETDAASAVLVAERIRTAVVALNVVHAASVANGVASVSIGVSAVVPPRLGRGSNLVEAADNALYDAKREGRNCTAVRHGVGSPVAQTIAGDNDTMSGFKPGE